MKKDVDTTRNIWRCTALPLMGKDLFVRDKDIVKNDSDSCNDFALKRHSDMAVWVKTRLEMTSLWMNASLIRMRYYNVCCHTVVVSSSTFQFNKCDTHFPFEKWQTIS